MLMFRLFFDFSCLAAQTKNRRLNGGVIDNVDRAKSNSMVPRKPIIKEEKKEVSAVIS